MKRRKPDKAIIIVTCVIILLALFIIYMLFGKDRFKAESGNEKDSMTDTLKASDTKPHDSESQALTGDEGSFPPDTVAADTDENDQGDAYVPFKQTLFIGDSRTTGLRDYSGIEGADFFASVGMNIFNLPKETVSSGDGETTLEELLKTKKYKRVYIMLGVNELGYKMEAVFDKYSELVENVLSLQHEATVYIQANLHVVKARSDSSDIYNNEKINKFNGMISGLANGDRIRYVDANELFDDSDGSLSKDYAIDDYHLLGKYYKVWGDWLRDK